MSAMFGGNLARLECAGHLEAVARNAESVNASVPILCGIAANRLYALLGVRGSELPDFIEHPQQIARLLDSVIADSVGFARGPAVREVLELVRGARSHLEEL